MPIRLADPLLTVADVAAALVKGESTVWRMLRDREIPSVKIGKSRRIRQSDLEAYIAALPVEARRSA
jgi:excisionase family DNA binding protein